MFFFVATTLICFSLPSIKQESKSFTANHQVHVTPRITAPFEVEVNYYANAKLVCNVTGYPTPRIQWKFANVRKDYLTFIQLRYQNFVITSKNLYFFFIMIL